MNAAVREEDLLNFLRDRGGEASLEEVSKGLGIPKYGPSSAYAILRALMVKGFVDRKGEKWVLVAEKEGAVAVKL